MNLGIQTRLLITTIFVLGTSLFITGILLDRSFQNNVKENAREQVRLVVYSLMGSLREVSPVVQFSNDLPEPRLDRGYSGLYAALSIDDEIAWESPSTKISQVTFPDQLESDQPGDFIFHRKTIDGLDLLYLGYTVIWEDEVDLLLTFLVSIDHGPFSQTIGAFRRNLYLGLGAVTIIFALALFWAVRWSLNPLRIMAMEIKAMEEGNRKKLSADWPAEIQGLADNLTLFISHEESNKTRYRKAMEDLAHSLKTPLSVIRNGLSSSSSLLLDQLDRMESSISYQLSKASAIGPQLVGNSCDLIMVIERLIKALQIAYHDRGIFVDKDLPEELVLRADEGDFMEILGNLFDNAFKYTGRKVYVSVRVDRELQILVEDDGPGIPVELREAVIDRGLRVDEIASGQGIGLSVVSELVGLYKGTLVIRDSALGGAAIQLTFSDLPIIDS